jgi:ferredoxin-NADP reductase/MOSC domain-containing protein YiiM
VEWQGKVVRTAIWKRPVSGRVAVRRLNIEGDAQADLVGHGGEHRAVMVYQIDSYKYWEAVLGRHDFEFGQFGENFTVEGLADDEVCIGDRYRIGSAEFEVTQPRVTCYRVGIRMNNAQMPSLLVSHRRPGFYFRVLREGEVGSGDEIEKIADGPERVSVAEIDGLLYLPEHPRDQLQRALRVPSLSMGWKESLNALLDSNEGARRGGNAGLTPSIAPAPAWSGYRDLRVSAVMIECKDVRSFVLETVDQRPLPPGEPGQFVTVKLRPPGELNPVLRSYSLSGPQGIGTYRISVKRAGGPGSNFLHDEVKVDDTLAVSAPRGSFTLDRGMGPVVFLSAGIGVTPVLSMLHSLASEPSHQRREVWWLYGARNREEHPFSSEARSILESLPNCHSLIGYSQPEGRDRIGVDYDFHGRLGLSSLKQLNVPKEANFYLCGPARFLAELTASLVSYGVLENLIHSEVFGAGSSVTPGIAHAQAGSPHPPLGDPGKGPTVAFTRSGLSVPWNNKFKSLLELAEACNVPVKWSCRAGVCHMCECGLVDGNLLYSPDPLDPPALGNALICCSTPIEAIALDL